MSELTPSRQAEESVEKQHRSSNLVVFFGEWEFDLSKQAIRVDLLGGVEHKGIGCRDRALTVQPGFVD